MVSTGRGFAHFVTAFQASPCSTCSTQSSSIAIYRSTGCNREAAVIDVRPPDGPDVEFVLASGKTQALVTLRQSDVRAFAEGDVIAVRDSKQSA
jgi:hypothetical protein